MSITPIFLSDVDSLETGEQNKVAEPVSLTRQSLDEGGIAVAVRVGAELEKAKKRIEELEGERDAANMAAEKASETSRVALEETENALARLTEAQNLRQDANAAFQAMREAGLMAGTRPVTLSNLTAKMIARMAELEVQLGEEKVYHERWYRGAVELTNKVEVLQAQLTEARNKTATLESQLSIYVANRASVQAAIEKAEGEKREAEQKLADERQKGARDYETLRERLDLNIAELNEARAQLDEWKEKAENRDAELVMSIEEKLAAEAGAARQREILCKVETYLASEDGPLNLLWSNGDICGYDDNPCDTWVEALLELRDPSIDPAILGYGTEWPEVLIYRAVLEELGRTMKSPAEIKEARVIANRDDEEIENRRLRAENARLRAALESVLTKIQGSIDGHIGQSVSVSDYFRIYKAITVRLYAEDVGELQSAINPAATVAGVKPGE